MGIRNIELEATMFGSLAQHVGVKATDICMCHTGQSLKWRSGSYLWNYSKHFYISVCLFHFAVLGGNPKSAKE